MNNSSFFKNFICRVGGLPSNTFQSLRVNLTFNNLIKYFDIELKIQNKQQTVSKIFFNCVALVTETKDRGFLLNTKRKLLKGININENELALLKKLIPIEKWKNVKDLNHFLISKFKLKEEIKRYYFIETSEIRQKLKSLIIDSDFQKGLLISSSSLYNTQNLYLESSNNNLNGRLEQIERGLIRYFSRMVMKATPFGTFCSIIPGKILSNSGKNTLNRLYFNADPQKKESLLQTNKELYGNLIEYCKNHKGINRWLNLELNSTIEYKKESLSFLTEQKGQEIFQELANNPVLELLINELQRISIITYDKLFKLIVSNQKIDAKEKEIESYIDRLIEIGFIRFKIGIPEQEVNWTEKLLSILSNLKDKNSKKIVDLLEQLINKTKKFKTSDVNDRKKILHYLNKKIEKTFNQLNIIPDLRIDLPFYEDATADCKANIYINNQFDCIEKSLIDYIKMTRKMAYPRMEQISMRHFFEKKYKNSDIKVTLLDFYRDFYKDHYKNHLEKLQKINYFNIETNRELENYNINNPFNLKEIEIIQQASKRINNLILTKWTKDLDAEKITISSKELGEITKSIGEVPNSPFSVSLFSQLFFTNSKKNETQIVISGGKYLLGFGKYFSRFMYLFGKKQQKELFENNIESNDIISAEICGDANFNANLHPPLFKWEIGYPTSEGGSTENEIKITDIVVEKHPINNSSLVLKHLTEEKYILPFDLGFLNPMMRPTLYQLLSKFSPPNSYTFPVPNKIPQLNKNNNSDKNKKIIDTPKIVYRPRIVFNDNIIIERRCWIIPSIEFPAIRQNENDVDYFIRINRWTRDNKIPEEVYAKINVIQAKEQLVNGNDEIEQSQESSELLTNKKEETTEIIKSEKEVEKKNPEDKEKRKKYSRDHYKPQYIDFRNPLLVNLFGRITVNLKNYEVHLEERYPNENDLFEYNGKKFVTEQIFQVNI